MNFLKIYSILLTTIILGSCSINSSTNNYTYIREGHATTSHGAPDPLSSTVVESKLDLCVRELPPLPDISHLDEDDSVGIIDVLIEHIGTLRRELSTLYNKSTNCN